jgi:hypothetical protein
MNSKDRRDAVDGFEEEILRKVYKESFLYPFS